MRVSAAVSTFLSTAPSTTPTRNVRLGPTRMAGSRILECRAWRPDETRQYRQQKSDAAFIELAPGLPGHCLRFFGRWPLAARVCPTDGRSHTETRRPLGNRRSAPQRASAARIGDERLATTRPAADCARLCRASGGELEQIQFLLGNVSVQTTERYLGCTQRIGAAVNDKLGIEPAS